MSNEPKDEARILTPVVLQKDFRGNFEGTDFRPLPETYDEKVQAEDPKDSSAPEPVVSSPSEETGKMSEKESQESPASAEKEQSKSEDETESKKPQKQTSGKQTPSGKDELLA